jgi:hypothetical protein
MKSNARIDDQEALRKHMQENHLMMNVFNCTSCEFATTVLREFKIHVSIAHLSVEVNIKQTKVPNLNKPNIKFECNQCDYECRLRIQLQKHCRSKHEMQQCEECTYSTNVLKKMVDHKSSNHAMVDFYCNMCEYHSRTPYEMNKHRVEIHQNPGDARYNTMQQLFLTGLSAQVDNLMLAVLGSKKEVLEQISELKAKNVNLETELTKTKVELSEVKEAFIKSNAFSIDMQHDSEAMLRNVADRCSKLEAVANKLSERNIHDKQPEVPKVSKANEEKQRRTNGLTKKAKVAWVGTSLSKQLSKTKFENDLKVDLKIERAYCIVNEADAHFPEKNFGAVVPKVVGNDDIDTLVLQAGSIEITNLDVNKTVKDPKKKIEVYKKQWFEKVEKDSSNLFDVAEDALKNSAHLQKVIIIKRLPRFDPKKNDSLGIKSQLSKYANTCYDQLWVKRGRPENIHIVNLDGLDSTEYLRNIIYGGESKDNYDGIHFRGAHAARHFTYRSIEAVKSIIVGPLKQRAPQPKNRNTEDYHRNCPQAQYQQRRGTNQRSENLSSSQSQSSQSVTGSQGVRYSDVVIGRNNYSVPVGNRFDVLGN